MNSSTSSSVTKTYSSYFKVVFLGIRNVGKTSIIRRILNLSFIPVYSPTLGIRFHNLSIVSNEEHNIQLWDISGNNIYSDYIRSFLRNTNILVLVFDYKNKESQFEIIKLYRQCIQDLSPNQIIVVGNKSENEKRDIPPKLDKWSKESNVVIYPISAKENQGISLLLQNILNILNK